MCDRIKHTIATNSPLLMGVGSASYPTPLEIFLHAAEHLDDHIVAIAEKRAALGL
jgi:hypothetical protein